MIKEWDKLPGGLAVRPTPDQRKAIAAATTTCPYFVGRVAKRVRDGGHIGPLPRGGANNVVIDEYVEAFIEQLWEHDVELELAEYQSALALAGVAVSLSPISVCLRNRLGLTLKKPSEVRCDTCSGVFRA